MENYVKRMEELEAAASDFPGIEKVFAIQAGREVRVMVKPTEVDDISSCEPGERCSEEYRRKTRISWSN